MQTLTRSFLAICPLPAGTVFASPSNVDQPA